MKILIKITKDVLKRTMMCSVNMDIIEDENDFKAKKGVGFNCAIGDAVNDLLPNAWTSLEWIHIYKDYYQMTSGVAAYSIPLPKIAQAYITIFDHLKYDPKKRLELPEINFEVDVPEGLISEIGISQAYKVLSESKTLELVSIQ